MRVVIYEDVYPCMPWDTESPDIYPPGAILAKTTSVRATRAAFLVLCFSAASRTLLFSSFCFLVLLLSRPFAFSSLMFLV